MSTDWDYGGAWRRHDMTGVIDLPNRSRVMVNDLTHGLPDWMRWADTVFTDPPCSTGNLRSFHTKAGQALPYSFSHFEDALFAGLEMIAPKHLFVEVFRSNREPFEARIRRMYSNVRVYDSHYYNKPANRCWIVHASDHPLPDYPLDGVDEAKAIAWICANHEFECIADPCMGRGLVGKHAYLNGRRFVGTELNPRRLGVLVDFIASAEAMRRCQPASARHRRGPPA